MTDFATRLIRWQKIAGRHGLPWSQTPDPYRIWISEIMLQQTQVATVLAYYQRFIDRFPDIAALALATEDEVLQFWSGLGYYSRARNLHRAAKIMFLHGGAQFPRQIDDVQRLPGIGRSTAAAICAFAYGQRHAILDGNVKRVLARCFGIRGDIKKKQTEAILWDKAQQLLPEKDIEIYTQALMDLGATVCVRQAPHCRSCPVAACCYAFNHACTAALPEQTARSALPVKETAMLILLQGEKILLQKRPSIGIWGGLWSFPEIARDADAVNYCADVLRIEVERTQILPALTHTFTHFKLRIFPWLLIVKPGPAKAQQSENEWLTPLQADRAAIPAAVRKILKELPIHEKQTAL